MPDRAHIEYELHNVKGHPLVALDGGYALIDTGSPFSIGRGQSFEIFGRAWNPSTSSEAILDTAAESVGCEIQWLLGQDFLQEYRVLLNDAGGRAAIDTEPIIINQSIELPLRFTMGVPLIDILVSGRQVRAILDSAATISYAPRDALGNVTPLRTVSDFYPMFGTFETDVWRIDVEVGGARISIEAGVLPDMLQLMLGLISEGWILGRDFFKGRQVVIDYPGSRILWQA